MFNQKNTVGHLVGIFFVGLAMFSLYGPYVTGKVLRMADTGNYLQVAFNLAVYGDFGEKLGDQDYLRSEPTYPYYLASIFKFSNDFSRPVFPTLRPGTFLALIILLLIKSSVLT